MFERRNNSCLGAALQHVFAFYPGRSLFSICTHPLFGRPADHAAAASAYASGNNLYDEDRFSEAVATYQQAISLDPQFAEAYHNLALAEEMVDRQKAVQDWQRFIDVGGQKPEMKFDVARAQARLQLEKDIPPLPDALQLSHYTSGAGDYYWQIAEDSDGNPWKNFPVQVWLRGPRPPPSGSKARGTRSTSGRRCFPWNLSPTLQSADIRVNWAAEPSQSWEAGETEWVSTTRKGGERKMAYNISVDWQLRNWTRDEMQAIILHEMGHALGIHGHSDSTKDIMYWQMQDRKHQVYLPRMPLPIFWRSLVKQPSPRDCNTLIHLL